MKKIIYNLTALAVMLCFALNSQAQCSNSNTQYGSSNAPTSVGVLTTLTSCLYGGEYRLVSNMQAGSQYSFETCGDTDFDTQITIYDALTGAFITYNDDYCGTQSKVSFVSNGNPVRVLINKYYCNTQSSCMTLKVTRVNGGVVNPCNSISNLTCTNTSSFSLSGSGAWNNLGGPYSTPGAEKVFSFTPTISGSHNITITNTNSWVDLFVKTGGCSQTGWTYIDDISSSGATNSVSLTAGVQYYFLIDDENTSAGSGTISVNCPSPATNPCNSITAITCGTSASYSLGSGNGAWSPPGPWGTPGEEAVFSYTPAISGAYDIQVLNSGFFVDLFYKTGSCSSAGWTYVNDISTNETNTVNLVGGVTYLFLIDDENTSPSSGSINVSCPCIPPVGGVDGNYTYNGPFVISGTTVGACDDCSLRSSNDRIYAIDVNCAGNYTFTTCGGAGWDTYLYLRTSSCGGSSIALNDDACGLQSSVSANLQPGTYYIHVEGFSSSSQGSFDLSISGSITPLTFNSNIVNVSCNNGTDGSVLVSATSGTGPYIYSLNNNSQSANTFDGIAAGTYSVSIIDNNACSSEVQSITISEPSQLTASSSTNGILCNGGSADISVSANGGTAPYAYSSNATTSALIISGVIDGPLSGGTPKAIEFYAISSISDLSQYGFGSANNGGGSDGQEFTFPAIAVTAGSYITVSSSSDPFISFFGVSNNYLSSAASINGDDAIELFQGGSVVDVFGDINVDGSGQLWDYLDGWAYRNSGAQPNEGVFDISDWAFSGTNVLDGLSSNASAQSPFPIGSFESYSENPTQTSNVFEDLSIGTYSYTVTDANGCSASTTIELTEPNAVEASAVLGSILCNGGFTTATINATGGITPYTFSLGGSSSSLMISGVIDGPLSGGLPKAVEFYAIDDINDLSTYGFGSANNGGGSDGQEFTFPSISISAGSYITVASEFPQYTTFFGYAPDYASSAANINGDDAIELFQNGEVVDVYGDINQDGTGQSWEYLDGWAYRASGSIANEGVWSIGGWSFSGTNQLDGESNNASASNAFPAMTFNTNSSSSAPQSSNSFTDLVAGSYLYTVEDANGCQFSSFFSIEEPEVLEAASTSGEILCNGGTTTVSISASGGTTPYIGVGDYTVSTGIYLYGVTDGNGCISSTTISISEPTLLVPSSTSGDILCNGGTTTVSVTAAGGTAPYTGVVDYTVGAGSYTYAVIDANGCTYSTSIIVVEPTLLVPSSTSGDILCNGGTTTVSVAAIGGTAPYSGVGDYIVSAGTYTYDVTDANGCTFPTTITVDEPTLLVPSSTSAEILCNGGTTTVSVSATGGTAPYSGVGDYTVVAGTYTYDVTDANGCTFSTTITVDEPTALVVYIGSPETVYYGYQPQSCADLSADVNGGTPGYTYNWSNLNDITTSVTVCPSVSTIYTMTATDANGCTASYDVTVCVIDVICYAGNSNNEKVEICHNFGDNNPHTICVNASAVAAHLAHGDVLGSCDEVENCGPVSGASGMITNNNNSQQMLSYELKEMDLYPNPATDELNVVLSSALIEFNYTIGNALGQIIYQGVISNGRSTINISSYSDGVYYMNIEGHVPEMFVVK